VKKLLEYREVVNPYRLAILVAVYISGKLTFTDLSKLVNLSKANLDYHLKVLERSNLIQRRKYITVLGPRTFIVLTEKGRRVVKELIKLFKDLSSSMQYCEG